MTRWPHPACPHAGHKHAMSVRYKSHICTSLFNFHMKASRFIYRFYVFFNATELGQSMISLFVKSRFIFIDPCYSVFQPMCRCIMNSNAFANSARCLSTPVTSCSVLFCDQIVLSRFNCCCLQIKAYDDDIGDMRYRSWLRHLATCWDVAGSRPDDVTNIFSIYLKSFQPH
jgi:hypothetical protein